MRLTWPPPPCLEPHIGKGGILLGQGEDADHGIPQFGFGLRDGEDAVMAERVPHLAREVGIFGDEDEAASLPSRFTYSSAKRKAMRTCSSVMP